MKEKNITETPDKWVVLKLDSELETIYKVFGSWAGGYMDGDRWKMNSGIKYAEEDDNHYYFVGYSGSCYKCHKKGYGIMTSFSSSVLDNIIDRAGKANISVSVMKDDTDLMGLTYGNEGFTK